MPTGARARRLSRLDPFAALFHTVALDPDRNLAWPHRQRIRHRSTAELAVLEAGNVGARALLQRYHAVKAGIRKVQCAIGVANVGHELLVDGIRRLDVRRGPARG